MNGLLLASSPESKDIKFNSKKIADTEDELLASESKFFQNLMEELLLEMPDSKNKDFLIAKILDLPEDFAKKEEIRSSFSDEKLFTDHQIDKVSIESLIEIASFFKNHSQEQAVMHFPTDSKALQTSLLDLNVQQEFKNARTISDLLKIAEKNGIEVKNFTFFKEEAALDTQSKEMIKKINSEEIFKLMEGQSAKQSKAVLQNNLTPSEIIQKQKEPDVLKHMLSDTERKIQAKESAFTLGKLPADHKNNTAPAIEVETFSVQEILSKERTQKVKKTDKNISTQIQTNKERAEKNRGHTTINPNQKIAKAVTEETVSQEISVQTQMKMNKNNFNEKLTTKRQIDKTIQQHIAANAPVKNEPIIKTTEVKIRREQNIKAPKTFPAEIFKNISQPSIKQENISKQKQVATDRNFPEMLKTESEKNLSETEQGETPHIEKTTISQEAKTQHTHQVKAQHTDLKKTFNTFAQEFKEQIENYKAPLMKIKMQLNPGNLGDVDITLINRGNNLHVNINSNPNTIAIFAQNQTEFKNALINMGFTGLQMNFGENKDNNRGQQHKDNNKQTQHTKEETPDKDGFEIIVPRYV